MTGFAAHSYYNSLFAAIAHQQLSLRRGRLTAFGDQWLYDNWWDILLVIYLTTAEEETESEAIAAALNLSLTIVDRWLLFLQKYGLVSRHNGETTGICYWQLTSKGRSSIEESLSFCELQIIHN
jgi:DNA-binding MarR family transcriptional regulator